MKINETAIKQAQAKLKLPSVTGFEDYVRKVIDFDKQFIGSKQLVVIFKALGSHSEVESLNALLKEFETKLQANVSLDWLLKNHKRFAEFASAQNLFYLGQVPYAAEIVINRIRLQG